MFSLSIDGGAAVSAESAGVQLRQRQRGSLRTDQLVMSFPRQMGGPVAVQPGQWIQVYLDNAPFFYGRVPRSTFRLSDSSGSQAVSLQGPWELLERWPALRDFNGTYGGTYGIPAFVTASTALRASWSLFAHNSFGSGICPTGYQMMYQLVAAEFMDASTHFTVAAFPAGETPPNTQALSGETKIADVLRMCAKWTPGVSFWFDYETSPPTLRAMPFEPMSLSGGVSLYWVEIDRTLVTGPGSAPDRWDLDYYVHTDSETAEDVWLGSSAQIAALEASIRWDMVPDALVVRSSAGMNVWPAGSTTNAASVTWLERSGGTPPSALTEFLFKSLSTPRLEASLTLNAGTGRPWPTARPGRVWNLLGDDSATGYGTAAAVTQSVTDDLLTGVTTCELGLSRSLGVGELLSLSQWAKQLGN